jgi:hypothetical protein
MLVDDFVQPDNWPALLPDAGGRADRRLRPGQGQAGAGRLGAAGQVPLVCVGAAGGKRQRRTVAVDDLADTTHDPLLASLRQRLRKAGAAPRQGRMGVRCVFSREPVVRPAGPAATSPAPGAALACAGYGSSVTVTATFGLVAAGEAIEQVLSAELGDSAEFLGYNARLCGWGR